MRAAIAIRPDYSEAYFMLGTVLKQQDRSGEAEEALRTAIRMDPSNPGPYNTLAQILRQKGELEESRRLFAEGARVKKAREAELGVQMERPAPATRQ
jgi:cytochrome c-type biogenesis protein CcmH/NrfG